MHIDFIARTDEYGTVVVLDDDALDFLTHHLNVYADDTERCESAGSQLIRDSLAVTAGHARSLASDLGYCDSPVDHGNGRAIVVQGRTMGVMRRA